MRDEMFWNFLSKFCNYQENFSQETLTFAGMFIAGRQPDMISDDIGAVDWNFPHD